MLKNIRSKICRESLIDILIERFETTVNWFKENSVIVNRKNFKQCQYQKQKTVKLLETNLEKKIESLQFANLRVVKAQFRLKHFLGFNKWKVLIKSFIQSNLNYCPLIWVYLNKIPLIDTLLFGNIVFQLCFGYVLLNKEIWWKFNVNIVWPLMLPIFFQV